MKLQIRTALFIGAALMIAAGQMSAADLSDTIKKADALYEQRYLNGKLDETITTLESVYEGNEKNFELNWKLARAYTGLRDYTAYSREVLLQKYKKGETYGAKAKELNPKEPEAWFWYAGVLGQAGLTRGILESLFAVGTIEDGLKRTIQLNKNFLEAYYGLAKLYRSAPAVISVGDIQKSIKYIEQALKLDGDDPRILFEAALIYKAAGDWKKADSAISKLYTLKSDIGFINHEIRKAQAEARELREEIRRHN